MRILSIARRELMAFFHAPIAYVVIVLFLALQGFSFWAVVEVLADPARPAGYGAVLRTQFGGSFLYWAVDFAVIALLAMRLVAEERRSGTWEALLTTPVGEGEVVAGKWLGSLAFYLLLWLPTAVYPLVLAVYAPPGTEVDAGPIAAAYLGAALSGAGFLALALAASSATENQVVAAVVAFATLLGVLLIGQLGDVAGDLGPAARAVVDQLDLRRHMDDMARGAVDLDAVVLWLSMAAVGLAAAVVLCARGRGSLPAARRRAAALGLVVLCALLANVLAARHPLRWDVSRGGINQLDPRTAAVLASVPAPVAVTVVSPEVEEFAPVYDEVDRLLGEMERAQPLLRRRRVDPTRDPEALGALAAELALAPRVLGDAGAVVFEMAGRRRGVDLLDLAHFGKDALDQGAMTRFTAEEAFARALAELAAPERSLACATSGHGEMSLEPGAETDRPHWGAVAERLRRSGIAVEDVGDVGGGVPERCTVLIVAGPEVPLGPDAALAVDRFLAGGGRALVAAADAPVAGALPATGLELVLAGRGVALPQAVVVDPASELELPLAWGTTTGYAQHPITAAFRGRRLTIWQHPRLVARAAGGRGSATPLVRAGPAAWAETDLAALFGGRDVAAGPGDGAGMAEVALAVEDGKSRLVVLGSAGSPSSLLAGRGIGAADALVASAVAWLAGRGVALEIGDRTPEHVRLIMTARDRGAVFAVCVVLLPLLAAGLGALLWWRRRRG
ncbi:MAG TPA: Gldg family protein [Kofleriaceae bacterium]|nr:Gldg family protein [Kofleriaceae bacterium]